MDFLLLFTVPTGIFFSLFVLGGVFLLLTGLLSYFGAFPEIQQGETVGTVTGTEVIQQSNADNETYYEAIVNYLYWVGEYSYEGQRSIATSHREKQVQAKLRDYSRNQKVPIVYNLSHHHLSRLQGAKNPTDAFTLIRVGLAFIVFGCLMFWGMTVSFRPDSWQNALVFAQATGITWSIAVALLLASCLHGLGTTVSVNLGSKGATSLFQQDPILFQIWKSSTLRWLNGFLAGLYLVLAIGLMLWYLI